MEDNILAYNYGGSEIAHRISKPVHEYTLDELLEELSDFNDHVIGGAYRSALKEAIANGENIPDKVKVSNNYMLSPYGNPDIDDLATDVMWDIVRDTGDYSKAWDAFVNYIE